MADPDSPELFHLLTAWRRRAARSGLSDEGALDELESHVREEMNRLAEQGFSERQAFYEALARLGHEDLLAAEFGKVPSKDELGPQHLLAGVTAQLGLFRHHVRMALRGLARQKGYAAINVLGLALGLAVFLVLSRYVAIELSYDRSIPDADRIYRIRHDVYRGGALEWSDAQTFAGLARAIQTEIPGVEAATRLFALDGGTLSSGGRVFNERQILFTDASFFRVFSIPVRQSPIREALSEPNTVVLTASLARKYFGTAGAAGKILTLKRNDVGLDVALTVTGVTEDPPPNTHLPYGILVSLGTAWPEGNWNDPQNWKEPSRYVYVKLAPGVSENAVTSRLPGLVHQYAAGDRDRTGARLALQPLGDIRLYSTLRNELGPTGTGRRVWTLMGAGAFTLVFAWINYISLATARTLRRAKEVGIRKLAGARRGALTHQFLFEAGLLLLPAALIASVLFLLSRSYLVEPAGVPLVAAFNANPSFGVILAAFLVAGTLLSGYYPALLLSAFSPAAVLKGAWSRSAGGVRLRKGLILLQFTVSTLLIATACTVYRQMSFVETSDLGFDPTRTLVVPTPNIRTEDERFATADQTFREQLHQVSAVQQVTYSSSIPGQAIGWITPRVRREGSLPETARDYQTIEIGDGFLRQFGIKLVSGNAAGSSFTDGSVTPCLVNEAAARALGFDRPEEAVGEYFISERPRRTFRHQILGVVRNFHQRSFREAYEPIILRYAQNWVESATHYLIKVHAGHLPATVAAIEALYRTRFPDNAFEYYFLADFFNAQYAEDRLYGHILGLFTLVALVISFLGLFGLAAHTAEQRTKEIGVRKALGASVPAIIGMLLRDQSKLVWIGAGLGLPLAWFAVRSWLDAFAFRIEPGWWFVAFPGVTVLVLSLLAAGFHAVRAALSDPVKCLRYE